MAIDFKSNLGMYTVGFAIFIAPGTFAQSPPQVVVITGTRLSTSGAYQGEISDVAGATNGPALVGSAAPLAIPPADANSSTNEKCTSPTTDNPVIIATGEKFLPQFDFDHNALQSLSLQRTYRSAQSSGSMFGRRWNASLDYPKLEYSTVCRTYATQWHMRCKPDWIKVHLPDGAVHTFTVRSYATYLPSSAADGDSALGLIIATGTPLVLQIGAKQYKYDYFSKNILSIEENGALLYSFTYSGDQLQSIASRAGTSVTFTWQNKRVVAVTAPDGKVWSYGYSANGNLTTVTPPASTTGVRTYHYEDPLRADLLTGMSIDNVRVTRYAYDSSGRATKSGFNNEEKFETFEYGADHTIVRNEQGSETRYDFEKAGAAKRLVKTSGAATPSCPIANAASNVYGTNGYLDYSLDHNGNKTDFDFNGSGQLISKVTAAGTTSSFTERNEWNGHDLATTTFADAEGKQFLRKSYTYVVGGLANKSIESERISNLVNDETMVTTYAYTFHGNNTLATVAKTTALPSGNATETRSYSSGGQLLSISNPVGHLRSWSEHDGLGRPGRFTDPNGVTSSYMYDNAGNLASQTRHLPGGNQIATYSYNNRHQVTAANFPDGSSLISTYNDAGRLTATGNASDEVIHYALGVADRKHVATSSRDTPALSGSTPIGVANGQFSSTLQLDSMGRPWIRTGNSGQRVQLGYDPNGNVKTRTDAAGGVTSYEYDSQDRIVKVTAPDMSITEMKHDAQGNLQYVVDARQLKTSYSYDSFGAKLSVTSPDTGVTNYTYDTAGRLLLIKPADGRIISHIWDAIGRLKSRTSGGVTETLTYDEGDFGKGHLTRIDDATGHTTYTYNATGQVVRQINNIAGKLYTTAWNYDAFGRLSGMVYPNGMVLSYNYDTSGRLASVKSN